MQNADSRMFSVVIPLFNEEENVGILHRELLSALKDCKYELIYVNDGSTDATISHLKLAIESLTPPLAKIISFSKNLGQSLAFKVGLDNASFDTIIFMDGDLQNDPADIPRLLNKFLEGYDLVQGIRVRRKDYFFSKVIPSKVANLILRFVCESKFHDLGCSLKVFSRKFSKGLHFYRGFHRVIPIYFSLKGAKTAEMRVRHRKRVGGKSKYGFTRTIEVLFEVIKINFLEKDSKSFIYLTVIIGFIFIVLGLLVGADIIRYSLHSLIGLLSFILGVYLFVIAASLYIIRSAYNYFQKLQDLDNISYESAQYNSEGVRVEEIASIAEDLKT